MNGYFSQHLAALRDALRRLVASPLNTLLSLLVIGIALALPSAGWLAIDNLAAVAGGVSGVQQISLFMTNEASKKDVAEIESRLAEARPGHWRFVARDAALKLKYVVITSVDRDDLRDGGSGHFVECIQRIRELSPSTQIEILTPDFRGRDDRALEILKAAPPDVMNHNLETAPRLYKEARPGSDYQFSLNLLKKFKELHPNVPTKSGIMVGLGETDEEILQVMRDMRAHNIDMLTIGQYLAPSNSHLPVRRYVHPDTFKMFEEEAYKMGFSHAAVGAMVRSSYHADQQAHAAGV